MKIRVISVNFLTLVALTAGTLCLATEKYPITGLTPSQRPIGAPVIEDVNHDKAWYKKGLTGISKPYPKSLYFMDNQGNWYTPFTRRGMSGRYDLRGWHQ